MKVQTNLRLDRSARAKLKKLCEQWSDDLGIKLSQADVVEYLIRRADPVADSPVRRAAAPV